MPWTIPWTHGRLLLCKTNFRYVETLQCGAHLLLQHNLAWLTDTDLENRILVQGISETSDRSLDSSRPQFPYVCSEASMQGEGWARLLERTYCPGLAAGTPPGFFGPLQRRPLSRVTGSACLLSGQRRRGWTPPPPTSVPSGSCQSPGSSWHPAGLPEESLLGVAALLAGRGGSEELGGSRGRPRRVPRARTPDRSGLRRESAAARPGRACARVRCHPWGLVSAPGSPTLTSIHDHWKNHSLD